MNPLESRASDDATAQELSERLADIFRTAEVGDLLTAMCSSMVTRHCGDSSSRAARRCWTASSPPAG